MTSNSKINNNNACFINAKVYMRISKVGFSILNFNKVIPVSAITGDWKEQLQKYISPDQLIQAYGGTRCEPDPWCTDHVSESLNT